MNYEEINIFFGGLKRMLLSLIEVVNGNGLPLQRRVLIKIEY